VGPIMVLEHLLKHAIRRGFRVIQQCHSTFLGGCPALLVAGRGRAWDASPRPWSRCPLLHRAAGGHACLPGPTWAGRRVVVVGRDQHDAVQDVSL
jgi:hypothetical protein